MKIIVIGCGRLGAALAEALVRRDVSVTVVDTDPSAFRRLPASFPGETLAGSGLDRETLTRAGIERADALATLTSSDDLNLVAARLAHLLFQVPRVVARLYDPGKAEVYRRLGVQTVSQLNWGVSRIIELLCYSGLASIKSLGNGEVDIVETPVPAMLTGRTVNELSVPGEIQVVAITREARTFLPTLGTELRAGDLIHMAVLSSSASGLKRILDRS